MKLKTNLIALAASVILVLIITGSGLVYTEHEIDNALSASKTITLIVNEVFQLNRLAADVNRAGIPRTRLQWQWKMDGLETLVSSFPQGDAAVDKMRVEMIQLNLILKGYMQTCEDVFALGSRDSFNRAIQFRIQNLTTYLHSMSSLTQGLLVESYAHVQKVRGQQRTFLIVSVGTWCILLVFWTLTLWSGIMTPVHKLLHSTAVVRQGNLAHRVAVKDNGHEMDALLISFNAMLDRLESLTKTRKTVFDITDREQAWVGRQLNEEISQIVTGIKLHLAVLKNENTDNHIIGKISFYLDQIQAEIKQILKKMQPVMLEEFGLATTLEWFCDEIGKNTDIRLDVPANDEGIPKRLHIPIFRIVQEAANNALSHGQPDQISIRINDHGNIVCLTIKDDGKGFELSKIQKGRGLTAMQVRCATEQGDFSVASEPEKGCCITASFPVRTNSDRPVNSGTDLYQAAFI
ncbi:ATP-binding protein [Desulfobacter vibrioformis]|uniref:sensor histidine kinase n=1 Tax=Desulfobacter vibrioformis TaxID=34031 RepID=UPI00054F5AC4|nr:ATP-binding protein [Desulfobacter vibrioformis]